MKSLQDYIADATTALFEDIGVFFAFNQQQLLEGIEQYKHKLGEGEKFVRMSMGMILPKTKVDEFCNRYENIVKEGIALDIAENGAYQIIRRELDNHEYNYCRDLEPTVNALSGYGFPIEQIKAATHGISYYKRHFGRRLDVPNFKAYLRNLHIEFIKVWQDERGVWAECNYHDVNPIDFTYTEKTGDGNTALVLIAFVDEFNNRITGGFFQEAL
jgi:hypothetical protein